MTDRDKRKRVEAEKRQGEICKEGEKDEIRSRSGRHIASQPAIQ